MNAKQKANFVTWCTLFFTIFFSLAVFYLFNDAEVLATVSEFAKDNLTGFFKIFVPVNFLLALMISIFILVIYQIIEASDVKENTETNKIAVKKKTSKEKTTKTKKATK